jgi:LacI family transcriptional regulator
MIGIILKMFRIITFFGTCGGTHWEDPSVARQNSSSKSKPVTATHIARLVGVAQSTVSAILAGNPQGKGNVRYSTATRDQVLTVAQRLGYRPNRAARSLLNGRHGAFGILVQNTTLFLWPEFLEGLTQALWSHGLSLSIFPLSPDETSDDPRALPIVLREDCVDGVIVFQDLPEKVATQLERAGLPVCWVNTNRRDGPTCITVDEIGGMEQAVRHLLQTGRRKIGFIGTSRKHHFSEADRRDGVAAAAAALKLETPHLCVLEKYWYSGLAAHLEDVLAELDCILNEHCDCDGWVLATDDIAALFVRAALRRGLRIPQDLAVVAVEDRGLGTFLTPSLTTLQVPRKEMGAAAVTLLNDLTNGKQAKRPLVFKQSLCVRESTAEGA